MSGVMYVSAERETVYKSDANVHFEKNTDIISPLDPNDPNLTNADVTDQEIEDGPLNIDCASCFK